MPVRDGGDFDVIVVGGGTTGIAAAIAAARQGARTAIVEYYGFLGGNSATGLPWLGYHNLSGQRVIGGVAMEAIDELRKVGGATPFYMDPIVSSAVGVSPHWWKIVAMRMTRQAGVTILLHSLVLDVERRTNAAGRQQPTSIIVANKGGLQRLHAKMLIDCTDSGDVAKKSGARLWRGREKDQEVQVASWTITIGGVDYPQLLEYFRANPDDVRPFPVDNMDALLEQMSTAEIFIMGAFRKLIVKARADGMDLARNNMPSVALPGRREFVTVATRIEGINPNDPKNFTEAEAEGMRQTENWMQFLRHYVPGFRDSFLAGTPHQIGIRETNHLDGDYLLTGDDLMDGRVFPDVIALGGYHLDIHAPNNDGGNDAYRGPPTFQIPYRSLVPRGVDGVLCAGRVISATHEAMAATRVIPISMAQGEAAGLAAALVCKSDTTVRDVSITELQKLIVRNRGIISHVSLPRDLVAAKFKVRTIDGHVSRREEIAEAGPGVNA